MFQNSEVKPILREIVGELEKLSASTAYLFQVIQNIARASKLPGLSKSDMDAGIGLAQQDVQSLYVELRAKIDAL